MMLILGWIVWNSISHNVQGFAKAGHLLFKSSNYILMANRKQKDEGLQVSPAFAKRPVSSRLSGFEWTLLWMAMRYAMNRQTIASVTLPGDIMSNWYKRLTNGQKQQLVRELKENEEDMQRMGYSAFGHKDIDRPHWIKFWKCLDESCHYEVELIDGSKIKVFEANGQIIPLEKYIEEPFRNWSVPPENIRVSPNGW